MGILFAAVVVVGIGVAVIATSAWFTRQHQAQKILKEGTKRDDLVALWQGDAEKARAILSQNDDPYSNFRRACLELHERDYVQARHWLTTCDSSDPATKVISQLIESEGGDVSWLERFVRAWNSSGRPDLRKSAFLGQDCSSSYEHGGDLAGLDETERALAAFICHPILDEYPAWLRRWGEDSDHDGDVVALLVAIEILRSKSGDLPSTCDDLIQLAASGSTDVTLSLTGFLHDREQRGFKDTELAALEAIANAPSASASLGDVVRDRFILVARKANLTSPTWSATNGAMQCLSLPPILRLFGALDATENSLQERAASIALKIGSRLLEDRFLVTFAWGNAITKFANKTLRRHAITAETKAREDEFASLQDLPADPRAWPLPDLLIEAQEVMWKNEIDYLRRFDRLRLPTATLVE